MRSVSFFLVRIETTNAAIGRAIAQKIAAMTINTRIVIRRSSIRAKNGKVVRDVDGPRAQSCDTLGRNWSSAYYAAHSIFARELSQLSSRG